MNEIEKCMNAAVAWLDQRIAQQVEQRLEQEREHLRRTMSDLIVEERQRVNALVVDVVTDGVKKGLNLAFDRIDAMLSELDRRLAASMRRRDDGGQPLPSKH